MPYATVQDFRDFHEPASGATNIKLATILDTAGWQVQKFAPPPDPVTVDYTDRALNAELWIAAYLFDTGGYRSNTGSLGKLGSRSFDVKGEAVQRIIRDNMGDYYQDAVAYLSREPL